MRLLSPVCRKAPKATESTKTTSAWENDAWSQEFLGCFEISDWLLLDMYNALNIKCMYILYIYSDMDIGVVYNSMIHE